MINVRFVTISSHLFGNYINNSVDEIFLKSSMGILILFQRFDILPQEELLEEQLAMDNEWLNLLVESALLRSKLHVLTGSFDQLFYLTHVVLRQRFFHIELKSLDLVHGPRI